MKKKTIAVSAILLVLYLLPAFYYLQVQQTNFIAATSKKVMQSIGINPGIKTISPDENTTGIYAVALTKRATGANGKDFTGLLSPFLFKNNIQKHTFNAVLS